jgi:hypothetical protein
MATSPDLAFARRLRSTSNWRLGLAREVRSEWQQPVSPSLGEHDPFARAAARFAAELELTAVVYDLVHEGLGPTDTSE